MFRRNFIGAAIAAACFSALPVQAQQIIKATDVHPLGCRDDGTLNVYSDRQVTKERKSVV
jgi:hypothetical protein